MESPRRPRARQIITIQPTDLLVGAAPVGFGAHGHLPENRCHSDLQEGMTT